MYVCIYINKYIYIYIFVHVKKTKPTQLPTSSDPATASWRICFHSSRAPLALRSVL